MKILSWLTRLFESNSDRDMQIYWLKAKNAELEESVKALLKQDADNERNRQEINRLMREINELKYGVKPVAPSRIKTTPPTDGDLIARAKWNSWVFSQRKKNPRPSNTENRSAPANGAPKASHSWPVSGAGSSREPYDSWSGSTGAGIAATIAAGDASPSASQGSCPSPSNYGSSSSDSGSSSSSSSDSGSSSSSCE